MANGTNQFLVNSIIWDWNGTLLDDRDLCVNIMNRLLKKYGLPAMTLDRYLAIFTFPIRRYYENLGFHSDVVPFEEIATEFIEHYEREKWDLKLRPDAKSALIAFAEKGQSQYILSASKQDSLEAMMDHFGIREFFKAIYGLKDHYAGGKGVLGRELVLEQKLEPKRCLYIGDTVHDAEVAQEAGIPCVLVQGGHNSAEKLKFCGCGIFRGLRFIPYFYH